MIRCLIVDDEAAARTNLRQALRPHAHWQVQAECHDADSARAALDRLDVDAVFLDIQMPGRSGIALAADMARMDAPPVIIFVTAHSGHALSAFDVHALDYLLKPFDDARLAQTLERATDLIRLKRPQAYAFALRGFVGDAVRASSPHAALSHFTVRSVGMIESIAVAEVRWIVASGNYAELHLADRKVLHRATLRALEQHLDSTEFMRVHRSVIVRKSLMRALSVEGDGVYLLHLRDGATLPVSERHAADVRTHLAQRAVVG
ncbi:MAG: response regulator transcription factor [Betaproteobacteria bacterium]|nr:response regulator transcription factor [Betaproteobacteria bacterium]